MSFVPNNGETSKDAEMKYNDTCEHDENYSDIYSYSEYNEFKIYHEEFSKLLCENKKYENAWINLSDHFKTELIIHLIDKLESSDGTLRRSTLCCIMYLAQGCWTECNDSAKRQEISYANLILFYKQGLLDNILLLLNMQLNQSRPSPLPSMSNTIEIRIIFNILFLMLETMRYAKSQTHDDLLQSVFENFKIELSQPIIEDQILLVKLLNILVSGSTGQNEFLPLKKILLCVWRIILITLGDFSDLNELKMKYRVEAGLTKHFENTLEILKTSIDPLNLPVVEDPILINDNANEDTIGEITPTKLKKGQLIRPPILKVPTVSSLDEDDLLNSIESMEYKQGKKVKLLPWKPKIHQKDLNMFLENLRNKYFNLKLSVIDSDTLFGLPDPIQEGIKTLKEHLYTPLAEIQLKNEDKVNRCFVSTVDEIKTDSMTEIFYETAVKDLGKYVIALLKIMLAATPLSIEKENLNIKAEIDVEFKKIENGVFGSSGLDIKRHEDIIVKSISYILLLLLKHLKLNHVLQFEYLSRCLMNANCLPFIIKYLKQYNKTMSAIQIFKDTKYSYNNSFMIDNPEIHVKKNIPTIINLLRILNKLVKDKQNRIRALIYFKSFMSLKNILKFNNKILQFYSLKLIKLQSKYQGRQWRKNNIQILGYVFLMVRHRFLDWSYGDWAYGNDIENKQQMDSQSEETKLKRTIMNFNKRRYANIIDNDFKSLVLSKTLSEALNDSSATSSLSEEYFKYYEQWVEQKVINSEFDWNKLLQDPVFI